VAQVIILGQRPHPLPESSPPGVLHQITINTVADEVSLSALGGGNHRQARSVCLLDRLSKRFLGATVHKDVHRCIRIGKRFTGEATGEGDRVAGEAIL